MTEYRYTAEPDYYVENPSEYWDSNHTALWAYNSPQRFGGHQPTPNNLAIGAFEQFYLLTGDDNEALTLTRRWLNIWHADKNITVETRTVQGYSQSDWQDVVIATTAENPEAYLNEYEQYFRGDVWVVTRYEVTTFDHGEEHLEDVDALGDIYANSEEEAI